MKHSIYILFFILFISFSYGLSTTGVTHVYHLDTTNSYNDTVGNVEGTAGGGISINTTHYKLGDGSAQNDGTTGYVQMNGNFITDLTSDYSVSCWIYENDMTGDKAFFTESNTGIDKGWMMKTYNGAFSIHFAGVATSDSALTLNASTWYNLIYVRNESSASLKNIMFINGYYEIPSNPTANPLDTGINQNFIGRGGGSSYSRGFSGYIDECVVFDYALTSDNATDLWNNGDGIPYPFSIGNMYISTGMTNNTVTNNNFLPINFTVTDDGYLTNTTATCDLIVNDVTNQTIVTYTNGTVNYVNLTFGEVEQQFNISVNCYNDVASASTGIYNYYVELINPIIRISATNNTNYTFNDVLNDYFNASDTNLYRVYYNITDSNNNIWNGVEYEFVNLTGGFFNRTLVYTLNTYGNFTVNIVATDSHTAINISNYDWQKLNFVYNGNTYKGIEFHNNMFNLTTDMYSGVNDFALIKKPDRYIFAFNFTDAQVNNTFRMYLDTKKNLTYLYDEKYGGYFVVNNLHWVDFVSNDVSNLQIDYLDNFGVWRIRFIPLKNLVVFNSIGDLNYAYLSYNFQVLEPSGNVTTSSDYTDILTQGVQAINMLWYWVVFGLSIIIIFMAEKSFPDEKQRETKMYFYVFSILINIALFFFVQKDFFGIIDTFKGILNVVNLGSVVMMVLGMDLR